MLLFLIFLKIEEHWNQILNNPKVFEMWELSKFTKPEIQITIQGFWLCNMITDYVLQVPSEQLDSWEPGSGIAARGLFQLPVLHPHRLLVRTARLPAGGRGWQCPASRRSFTSQPLPHPAGAVHTPLGHCWGVFTVHLFNPTPKPLI